MKDELWERFQLRLDGALIPFEGLIAYGNLRKEASDWGDDQRRTTNVAIIYETPGGSTNQVNIGYQHQERVFVVLDPQSNQERQIQDLEELFGILRHYLDEIPARRQEALQLYIRSWREEGFTRQQALVSLRSFLYTTDLKGGIITEQELTAGARYVVRLYAPAE